MEGAASEEPRVAYEAGGWCRRLHTEELPGWGPLVPDTDTSAHGRYDSPRRAVDGRARRVPDLIAAGVLDRSLADAATALVRVDAVLAPAGPGSCCTTT